MGFKKVVVGTNMTLAPCMPSRTGKDREPIESDVHAVRFREALAICIDATSKARWPDVAANMVGKSEINGAVGISKVREQLNTWFKRWPGRAEYDTGERGPQNAVILRLPN